MTTEVTYHARTEDGVRLKARRTVWEGYQPEVYESMDIWIGDLHVLVYLTPSQAADLREACANPELHEPIKDAEEIPAGVAEPTPPPAREWSALDVELARG